MPQCKQCINVLILASLICCLASWPIKRLSDVVVAVDTAEVIGWVEGLMICLAERGVDCTLSAIRTSLETRPNSQHLFKFIFTVWNIHQTEAREEMGSRLKHQEDNHSRINNTWGWRRPHTHFYFFQGERKKRVNMKVYSSKKKKNLKCTIVIIAFAKIP